MKLYYKIMISSIYTAQNNGPMSDIWKFASNFYFAFATSMYIMFICRILDSFIIKNKLSFLVLKIMNHSKYNFILNVFVYIILPIMSINYYTFLKDNKYRTLIKEYKNYYTKKAFAIYFGFAFLSMFLSLFLKR